MNHGEEPSSKKRPRFVWTDERCAQFVKVVKQLGKDAVPKNILLAMNEPGLTREIVGSHLQKHRENEKKREREGRQPCEQRHINNRILVPPVASSASHGMLHLHLLQASTTDSPPPPQPQMQRHHYNHQHLACQPQIQHEHHEQHLARQSMQFNNFDGVTSLIGNGSNNLTSMHQHDRKPVLSFQVNTTGPAMHQPDRITSFKSNMPQQLDQNPSSVSVIINQDQALGTPLGRSNIEQLDQNRSLGTYFEKSNMERQPITQNLTSGTQQLDQNPGTQQLDQSQSSGSGIINQNHALGSSFERINMEQQPITQNLTSGTQQLDQNPGTQQLHQSQSSGSGIINQNHGQGTFFERINMEEQLLTANLTSSTQQLDQTSCPPIRSGYDGMITPEATLVDEYEFVDGLLKPFEDYLDVQLSEVLDTINDYE